MLFDGLHPTSWCRAWWWVLHTAAPALKLPDLPWLTLRVPRVRPGRFSSSGVFHSSGASQGRGRVVFRTKETWAQIEVGNDKGDALTTLVHEFAHYTATARWGRAAIDEDHGPLWDAEMRALTHWLTQMAYEPSGVRRVARDMRRDRCGPIRPGEATDYLTWLAIRDLGDPEVRANRPGISTGLCTVARRTWIIPGHVTVTPVIRVPRDGQETLLGKVRRTVFNR